MKSLVMVAALAGAAQVSAAEPNVWRACTIDRVSVCAPDGCTAGRPTIWLYLASYVDDKGHPGTVYMRCNADKTDCDTYEPVVHRSGAYLNFSLPQNGVVSKLASDDTVTDVATLMDTVFISRGKCTLEPPPIIRTNVMDR